MATLRPKPYFYYLTTKAKVIFNARTIVYICLFHYKNVILKIFSIFYYFCFIRKFGQTQKYSPMTIKLFVNKNKIIKDFLGFKSQTNLSVKQNKIGELQLLLC